MEPSVLNVLEDDETLRFTVGGINVAFANAIRRVIVAEIPTVVMRTSPHDQDNSIVTTNTTRMNNGLIKQRLACIPVHVDDPSFDAQNYAVDIQKRNDGETIDYVTTADFRVRNVQTGKYLTDDQTRKLFPPCPLTGDHIDVVRIRPRVSDEIPGEELDMTCRLSMGMAKDDGAFNVASTCVCAASIDAVAAHQAMTAAIAELKAEGADKATIERAKHDWNALRAKRFTKPDSHEFAIESVGVFSNGALVQTACAIMVEKLNGARARVESDPEALSPLSSECTIENGYDVDLTGEDYTLGKVLEYVIYSRYFGKDVTYCAFRKPHPHRPECYIRLGFAAETDKAEVTSRVAAATDAAAVVFERIRSEFDAR